ncbi:hypothetical protein [Streptomyces katsurahamanus]|uniref:Uncharacterized protein n=1 Tax=Streptomyces katsurahamanus TaxID=2577098 RepID=A0ABW9NTC1_9ACTN|nr:hypothetical protein [Streptomyces katsurahamanus]MQS36562.1 hypothetical protein [Streptomyces katsurahamanus]
MRGPGARPVTRPGTTAGFPGALTPLVAERGIRPMTPGGDYDPLHISVMRALSAPSARAVPPLSRSGPVAASDGDGDGAPVGAVRELDEHKIPHQVCAVGRM